MSDRIYINYRDPNTWTVRSALANLSAEDVENIFERDMLLKYQDTLRQLKQKEQELYDTRELLRNIQAGNNENYLSMKKGLEDTGSRLASQIDTLERKLIDLQNNPILKNVIDREKAKARERWEQEAEQRRKVEEARVKESAERTERELRERYQKSRQEALQKRAQVQQPQKQEIIKETKTPREPKSKQYNVYSIKERLTNTLGSIGFVLYYMIRLVICILPFVMIGSSFFLTLLLISINYFIPLTSVVFWVWGLVCAIKGVQDFWAVLYYIVFAVAWLPFFVSTLTALFSKEK